MNTPILPQESGSSNQVTMTSPEIVDFINAHRQSVATIEKPYVELHHRSFMSKVPQVLGISNAANFLASQNYGNNNTRQIYVFPKREACLMAMSYSYELQAQIFDRMTAMEEALKAQNLPSYAIDDPIERAKKWIEEEKQKQAAIHQLELAAPKVQYFDKVVDRSTLLNATQVAQKLGMSAVAMNKLLDDLDVYSRNVKRARVFKQWFIDAGYGELKQTELGFSQPMFTTKGEAWAIEKLVSEGVA